MRSARTIGRRSLGIRNIKGGRLGSNLTKLAQDFASSVAFGKSEPTMGSAAIKKKFSI